MVGGAWRLEFEDEFVAYFLRGAAVEAEEVETVTREYGFDQIEERGELRKDDALECGLSCTQCVEMRDERAEFGRCT